ncbi:Pimeloyl-ACP methyl ester carboxylesterase [Halolactibacillus halophilus]|uniref:Alpha/beta hydrolase n=1 Tax=Halolactibacillus halophilus TaxID=306540 RepID=A0A1I5SEH7_9BACI|nr:alpha/beta hydrolase [Halolactibacillus halophilus]GEM02563.1 alpha/beta hydrolase [Halolactibacillus halophilus]SFP69138.1 Pimeloyl-ACP methyl ester carboxylesterase [Halolactibacillus halophilus]
MKKFKLTKNFSSSFGNISYDIQGEGPPIILVHGTPWSSFNWRHIIPALSQWFTVYYYDLLGYGQSEKPNGNVSLGIQDKIFSELLDHWDLKNPIVIGHDFGGTTVLRTHLLRKRNFEKIILVDPVAIAPWGSDFFSHVNKHEKVFQGIPEYIHKSMVSTYVQGAKYKAMDQETLEGIVEPWQSPKGQSAFYRQIAQADQKYTDEIESLYSKITQPVLIVWGEQDSWIPLESGHKLHNKIKTSTFTSIPNAGHLVQEDQPTELMSCILKFLFDKYA